MYHYKWIWADICQGDDNNKKNQTNEQKQNKKNKKKNSQITKIKQTNHQKQNKKINERTKKKPKQNKTLCRCDLNDFCWMFCLIINLF